MAYTVDYTDTEKTVITIADGEVDVTTDLSLIGKDYSRFGEIIAENFLHLLENFANDSAPPKPVEGQFWFDNDQRLMKYFDNTVGNSGNWKSIASMTVGASSPTSVGERNGHLWLDTDDGQLYMYYNGWRPVGLPAGNTRFNVRTRIDSLNVSHKTLEMVVNGEIVTVHSSDTDDWVPNTIGATTEFLEDGVTPFFDHFPVVKQGVNMNTSDGYLFSGTATSAQYADLAERYESDMPLEYGTVVVLGGKKEVTQSTEEKSRDVFGIVSTKPGLMMNSNAGTDKTHPYIALSGRVPCKVVGVVKKGDRIVSSRSPGHARAVGIDEPYHSEHVIGRSLEEKINAESGIIEVVVGVK